MIAPVLEEDIGVKTRRVYYARGADTASVRFVLCLRGPTRNV